jgi:putative glutamine amidotransferase
VNAVAEAGGVPVLVPLLEDEAALRVLYERVDGILLPGGADLSPTRYRELPHPEAGVYGVDEVLDHLELALARWALAEGKPVLGVCRGHQALNVAAGGSLYQDIGLALEGALIHWQDGARDSLVHPIAVARDSRLAAIFGATDLYVNSMHHQAVADLAPGFRGVARAPDGVLEALEHETHPFALAVQFHPEELIRHHAPSLRLFAAFIAACGG